MNAPILETEYLKCPFRVVAEDWLAEMEKKLAKTTFQKYESTLERYILPAFGNVHVNEISKESIEEFVKNIMQKHEGSGKNREQLKSATLNFLRLVIKNVIEFAELKDRKDVKNECLETDKKEYSVLSEKELRKICACAKYNHCPELLAAMLMIFNGIRVGEVCAVNCDDIDLTTGEVYIHESVHRIKNRSGEGGNKTISAISEIPTKKQIRTEVIPDVLVGYLKDYYNPGAYLLTGIKGQPMEAKTLRNRIDRIFGMYKLGSIPFQRFRKTYVCGKANLDILNEVLAGKVAINETDGSVDTEWLKKEMANDLPSLRLLLGISAEELSDCIGIPKTVYKNIEDGKANMTWTQYLAFLFFFYYNPRTGSVVESLGLYPKGLDEMLSL